MFSTSLAQTKATAHVFGAMTENQHLEPIESQASIELSEEVGRAFVRFMYCGELEKGMLEMHASAFLELCEKYDVQTPETFGRGGDAEAAGQEEHGGVLLHRQPLQSQQDP